MLIAYRSSSSYFCEHIIKAELMSITARPALAPEFWAPADMFEGKPLEVRYVSSFRCAMEQL
jgi:hypothetical protein